MNFTLTRYQRTLLLFLSAAGYSAWFSGVGERLEAQDMGARIQPTVRLVSRPLSPWVPSLVTRDPFAGSAVAAGVAARATATPAAVAGYPVVPDIQPVKPDAAPAVTDLALRATIAGSNPVAYVASGTMMNIVRIGDSLGERRITDIDLRGLSFSDGSRLDLPDTYLATPAPRRAGSDTINVRLQDLRRLLAPERSGTPTAASTPAPLAPQPAGTQPGPTPAPLGTVDRNGHPAGTIFTPDPNAPTAFPYPYPYAPAAR